MTHLRTSLIAVAAVFFLLTAWYGRPAGLWNSPDETANAFWAERVAHGQPLTFRDAIVGLGAGAIHPRSMAVSDNALIPGSFSGLILLYGALRLITKVPLFLFTPIFTLVAGVFFGVIIGRLFDRRVGVLSALLFFLHPAVLYYGARGLFHNLLFIDLLILSVACFVCKQDRAGDALGGFLFGWAILTRASEAVWAVPAFLLFLPLAGARRWRRLGWALVGVAVPLFLFLQTNASLYGSPLTTPYVAPPAPVTIASDASEISAPSAPAHVLPFGFDARRALRNAWEYGLRLFWWQSLLAVSGLILWCVSFRKATTAQKIYALAALLTAVWLAVLYGSWAVRDRLDPSHVTIGTSYVRYFLPAYVAMLPFGALALVRFGDRLKKSYVVPAAIALIGLLTVHATIFAGDESLRAVRATLAQNVAKQKVLLSIFPQETVIMTERFDKLFVPHRLRIIPTADEAGFQAAAIAALHAPVYWYGLTPSAAELGRLESLAFANDLIFALRESPIPGETMMWLIYGE